MAEYTVHGPDKPLLTMAEVCVLLGNVSDKQVERMIGARQFPAPFRAGPKSPPQWTALTVACWLHLAPQMRGDPPTDEDE